MNESAPLQSPDEACLLRNEAIDLYLVGESVSAICRRLERSRPWFYEALHRYRRGGRAALQSQSRAAQRVHNRTEKAVEAAVVRIRRTITAGEDPELRYANIGAPTLRAELERAGLPPPSESTIYRILRRHGLQQPRSRRQRQPKLPADYPWPCVEYPNQMHVLDFVTKTTATIRRVYGCNLLDQARQRPFLRLITEKSRANVAQFLVSAWQVVGLPGALHIDNDSVWRGSSSGQRSFSHIVRLCLLLGVEVIFIPSYTPEANALIESFNAIWQRNFWQRTTFTSLAHMARELAYFERWCLTRRPLASHDGQTADQLLPDFVPILLPPDFDYHKKARLPLAEGKVHFIRFVDEDGDFHLLNETWSLGATRWAGRPVRATVDTARQELLVYHQPESYGHSALVKRFAYELSEKTVPRLTAYERERTPVWPECELCDC